MKALFTKLVFVTILAVFFSPFSSFANEKQNDNRYKLLKLFSGEWISKSLYVVTKLEIADHLKEEVSIKQLGVLTNTDPSSLSRIMHLLASVGVFEEIYDQGGGIYYKNNECSSLLVKTHESSLHHLALFYGEDIHKSWDSLLDSLHQGEPAFNLAFEKPVFAYFKNNPDRHNLFQEAMREKSKAVIDSALKAYDFSKFKVVYDIGGGYGHFMQALLGNYSNLNGLVFEVSEVIDSIKISPSFIDRCALCKGDFFSYVPSGADAYMLKSVIHDWSNEQSIEILKSCHNAMAMDSKLLLIEVVLKPKNESVYANCMDVLMLAITGGKERSLASFESILGKAGFKIENIYPTSTEFSIIEAVKI